jgi:hypothetical protein
MARFLGKCFSYNPFFIHMKKTFNPLLAAICFSLFLVFSCGKEKLPVTTCDVKNPLEELIWLNDKIQGFEQLPPEQEKYIMMMTAIYQGETVFIQTSCDPLGNSAFPVMNCSGELLGVTGQISQASLTNLSILWIPPNSACNAND